MGGEDVEKADRPTGRKEGRTEGKGENETEVNEGKLRKKGGRKKLFGNVGNQPSMSLDFCNLATLTVHVTWLNSICTFCELGPVRICSTAQSLFTSSYCRFSFSSLETSNTTLACCSVPLLSLVSGTGVDVEPRTVVTLPTPPKEVSPPAAAVVSDEMWSKFCWRLAFKAASAIRSAF